MLQILAYVQTLQEIILDVLPRLVPAIIFLIKLGSFPL